jgi:hypothetical protein
MSVIRAFEHGVVAESFSVHWPGEYPPTPLSPRSLKTLQVSRYGKWTVVGWASQVAKIMLATQTISQQVEYITRQMVL